MTDSTRETKEITTPSGAKIALNTYITGRDRRKLRNIYLRDEKELDATSVKEKGAKGTMFEEAQDLALKTVVVSINGKKEGQDGFSIVDFILDLPSKEFEFVIKAVNDVTSDKIDEEKKTN